MAKTARTRKARRKRRSRRGFKRNGRNYVARTAGGRATTERKYFDTNLATYVVKTTWATAVIPFSTNDGAVHATGGSLNCPGTGSQINQRIGRLIHGKKLKIKGELWWNCVHSQTTNWAGGMVRMVVVVDTQCNGTVLTPDVLFKGSDMHSFQSIDSFGRFKVLYDRNFIFRPQTSNLTTDNPVVVSEHGMLQKFKIGINMRDMCTTFNQNSNKDVGDIVDNSIYLLALCDSENNVGTIVSSCSLTCDARYVYLDK